MSFNNNDNNFDNDNIVLFTGGFDPIHSGHISCINEAKSLGRVVIGLNSDSWLIRKKGKFFMSFEERKAVISEMNGILTVIEFDDSDGSACDAIIKVKKMFPKNKIIIVNGGDRTKTNIPEMASFENDIAVNFVFSIGGNDKKNSSSSILEKWLNPLEEMSWGKLLSYYDTKEVKIKRLIIPPNISINMQYSTFRSGLWFIEDGEGEIYCNQSENLVLKQKINKFQHCNMNINERYQIKNTGNIDLQIIEIQYGCNCIK